MNSQIKIKRLPSNIFDYEIIIKDHLNYWYNNPAKYSICNLRYNSTNAKMVFQL